MARISKTKKYRQFLKCVNRESDTKSGPPVRRIRSWADRKKLEYIIHSLRHSGKRLPDDILETCLEYCNDAFKEHLIVQCRERIQAAAPERVNDDIRGDARFDDLDETISELRKNTFMRRIMYRQLYHKLTDIHRRHRPPRNTPHCALHKKIHSLSNLFHLSNVDTEVLLALFFIEVDCGLNNVYDDLRKLMRLSRHTDAISTVIRPLNVMLGVHRYEVGRALAVDAPLMAAGLVNQEQELAEEVLYFLEGASTEPISQKYFTRLQQQPLPLSAHTVERSHIDTLTRLITHRPPETGLNILLYGSPGTGKTEFARSLGAHLEHDIYDIKSMDDGAGRGSTKNKTDPATFRYRALIACQRTVDTRRALIIVDEADALLNSRPQLFSLTPVAEKGQVNRLLDTSSACIVWITNRWDGIAESTRRRFDYSLEFSTMTFSQRKSVWQHSLQKHDMCESLREEDIDTFAARYQVSAGGIDVALRNAARLCHAGSDTSVVRTSVERIMQAHVKMINGREHTDITRASGPDYSLEGLSIRHDVDRTLTICDKFNLSWDNIDEKNGQKNLNLLLYGPPGTGKTEFAKHLARRMNRRLLIKTGGDFLNMYVGETEQRIRAAFEEASRDRAILLIDEADTLLGSRDGAMRSWEISRTNEMLTHMDRFSGMLICATNFNTIVDSAAMRRFSFKLPFDYLTPDGIKRFYNLFCAPLTTQDCPPRLMRKVCALRALTPGDFKVVYQNFSFFPQHEVSHDMLVQALAQEVAQKNEKAARQMGFSTT